MQIITYSQLIRWSSTKFLISSCQGNTKGID